VGGAYGYRGKSQAFVLRDPGFEKGGVVAAIRKVNWRMLEHYGKSAIFDGIRKGYWAPEAILRGYKDLVKKIAYRKKALADPENFVSKRTKRPLSKATLKEYKMYLPRQIKTAEKFRQAIRWFVDEGYLGPKATKNYERESYMKKLDKRDMKIRELESEIDALRGGFGESKRKRPSRSIPPYLRVIQGGKKRRWPHMPEPTFT